MQQHNFVFCCDKHNFLFCCRAKSFVAASILLSWQKTCLSRQKWYFVAAPGNDSWPRIWTRTRPRALVQNQQTRELITLEIRNASTTTKTWVASEDVPLLEFIVVYLPAWLSSDREKKGGGGGGGARYVKLPLGLYTWLSSWQWEAGALLYSYSLGVGRGVK